MTKIESYSTMFSRVYSRPNKLIHSYLHCYEYPFNSTARNNSCLKVGKLTCPVEYWIINYHSLIFAHNTWPDLGSPGPMIHCRSFVSSKACKSPWLQACYRNPSLINGARGWPDGAAAGRSPSYIQPIRRAGSQSRLKIRLEHMRLNLA